MGESSEETPDPPTSLVYDQTTLSTYVNYDLTAQVPTFDGEELTFSIDPALPDGLTLDANDGTISGTPTEYTTATEYTVTASNSSGSVQTTLSLATPYGFVVDTTDDSSDQTIDGICLTASNECSLRAAIEEANASIAAIPYIIEIPEIRVELTGEIPVTAFVDIRGASRNGTIIDGNDSGRHFEAAGAKSLSVQTLTLRDGRDANGGSIRIGSSSVVNIDQVSFLSNFSTARGGAITVQTTHTGTVNISNAYFYQNYATTGGGAINMANSTLEIEYTYFYDNDSDGHGAGIRINSDADVAVRFSTFEDNQATSMTRAGGGIYHDGSNLEVITCTFHNNLGPIGGGAVYVDTGATAEIWASTITSNDSNVGSAGGGISGAGGGAIRIGATILSGNTALAMPDNCGDNPVIVSDNANLSSTAIGDCAAFTQPLDLNGVGAGLAAIQGSPIPYRPLNAGSNALDRYSTACDGIDIRGVSRPQNGTCDIGAYERE